MLLFFDESGDTGMKFGQGSSDHFIVAAVFFRDRNEANRCDEIISDLRRELNITRNRGEFHFAKVDDGIRVRFFEAIAGVEFVYSAFVLNKRNVTGPGFRDKASCYKYPTRLLLENLAPHLTDATIVLDKCGNRTFCNQLKKYLQQHGVTAGGPNAIKKIKQENSHTNNLIQLADMICGAVARCYASNRRDKRRYHELIRHNEMQIRVWPDPPSP
ncbi:DUF3800 domain-containing protein [Allorhodopirellula solitaria]|uniref:DUF3800 domain-containing protein n=1 Tax=Allorhodopirellula solitaria TaxID=2527987 RepID=A0A5C5YK40_9BACT|nr:DUF3800 domain-containing protein [Allorhodopirellula solitaria]TWT75276.1 hypothetical protein CA85_05660 [Allorhodopirellula solitaria]